MWLIARKWLRELRHISHTYDLSFSELISSLLSIPYCWVCCMRHKSPRANNCPSPAPAGVHVFHTCGRIMHILKTEGTAGSSARSPKEGTHFSSISPNFFAHFPSLLLLNAKVIPDIQRAFSLNRNWHRLSISACSCLCVCLYTVQMQDLWRPCGLGDTMAIQQIWLIKWMQIRTGKYLTGIVH